MAGDLTSPWSQDCESNNVKKKASNSRPLRASMRELPETGGRIEPLLSSRQKKDAMGKKHGPANSPQRRKSGDLEFWGSPVGEEVW